MFFHPNGTVKKLVINMKEGKHMLKNKRVVKALTIGLATVLATPSMTAFAAAPGDTPTADDNQADLTVDVVKEPVAVASENEQAIKDASKLTDDAQKAEQKVYNDAYFSQVPFDEEWNDDLADVALDEYDEQTRVVVPSQQFPGFKVVEPDDSANEFDENAGDHLDGASGILDQGEKDLTDKLEEFEEKIDEVNTAKDNADTAQANATAEAMKAEGAETAANAAGTSAAARPQEAIAKEAADKAAEYAGEAQDEATKSYNAYLEAKAKYEEAETIAKNANEAADKAVDASLEDAKVAAEFAKQAEKDAEALKVEMEIALAKARGTQAYYQGELTRIENRLNELASEKQQLDSDYAHAHAMYDKETQAWRDAFDAVSEARKALSEAPSQWEIIGDTWKVQALEKALVAAEKVLWADGKAFFDANDKANSLKIKKELQDAYDLIKEAYDGKLEENQKLEDAIQNEIDVIDGEIADLKEKYGDNIGEIQATLLNAEATEEDKEAAVKNLINNITSLSNAERFETNLFEGALYKVTDADGKTQFYTYEIRNGVIYVAKVTETVENKIEYIVSTVEPTYADYNTKEELEAAIAEGLLDGTYYYDEVTGTITDSRPTGKYDITYTETELKRGYDNKYDVEGQTGKVIVDVTKYYGYYTDTVTHTFDVIYITDDSTGNKVWAFYYDEGGRFKNDWYLLSYSNLTAIFPNLKNARNTNDVLSHIYLDNINVTMKDVAEEDLYKYSNKANYSATALYADTEVPTTVYTLVSNVKSITGTNKDELIAQAGDNFLTWRTIKIPGKVSSEEVVVDLNSPTTHMWNMAPELENGKPKYKCVLEYLNGKTFTYDPEADEQDNTLRWHNSRFGGGYWEVYTKQYGTTDWWKATIGLDEKYQYNHLVKEYNKTKTVNVEVDGEVDGYIVYYKGTGETTSTTQVTTYTSGEFAGIDSLSALNTDRTNKSNNLGTVEDYNEKKAAYEEAKDEADAAWKKFVESKKNRDITGINLWKARKELNEAIAAKKKAEDDLAKAEWNFYWQDLKTAGAKAALDDITGKLAYNAGATAYNQGAKQIANMNLQAAKAKVGEYTYKANVAKKLAIDAKKARRAAVKAREAIKKIKASNLGADALEAAYAELEAAKQAYKDAQAAADLAAEEAKAALQAYNNVVNRINALVAAENAAAAGEGEGAGEGETTTGGAVVLATIPTGEEVPGAPAAPVAGGAGVAANVAPAAVEAATTDITTPDTALSAAVPEDNKAKDDLTQIMPQAPALAADIADTEHLTWWWLLVVAVLGGTGYAMYKKFQTKKEEKVTK